MIIKDLIKWDSEFAQVGMSLETISTVPCGLLFRSINYNMMYLFTYTDFKSLNIPSSNNNLEGMFGHIKERVKIHCGLTQNRKKKAVRFLLGNCGRKSGF